MIKFKRLINSKYERDYFTFSVFSGEFYRLTITFIVLGLGLDVNLGSRD